MSFGEHAWSDVFGVEEYLVTFLEVGVGSSGFVFRLRLCNFGLE